MLGAALFAIVGEEMGDHNERMLLFLFLLTLLFLVLFPSQPQIFSCWMRAGSIHGMSWLLFVFKGVMWSCGMEFWVGSGGLGEKGG